MLSESARLAVTPALVLAVVRVLQEATRRSVARQWLSRPPMAEVAALVARCPPQRVAAVALVWLELAATRRQVLLGRLVPMAGPLLSPIVTERRILVPAAALEVVFRVLRGRLAVPVARLSWAAVVVVRGPTGRVLPPMRLVVPEARSARHLAARAQRPQPARLVVAVRSVFSAYQVRVAAVAAPVEPLQAQAAQAASPAVAEVAVVPLSQQAQQAQAAQAVAAS